MGTAASRHRPHCWGDSSRPHTHLAEVRHLQPGLGGGLDGDHRLLLEAADGAEVLVGDVRQRGQGGGIGKKKKSRTTSGTTPIPHRTTLPPGKDPQGHVGEPKTPKDTWESHAGKKKEENGTRRGSPSPPRPQIPPVKDISGCPRGPSAAGAAGRSRAGAAPAPARPWPARPAPPAAPAAWPPAPRPRRSPSPCGRRGGEVRTPVPQIDPLPENPDQSVAYIHWMLFLDFLRMSWMPSSTLVMS